MEHMMMIKTQIKLNQTPDIENGTRAHFNSSTLKKRLLLISVSAVAMALMPSAALAQTTDDGTNVSDVDDTVTMDRVIVEARKREEALINIPETIDVITSETIAKAGIDSLEDVGRQTPNIILNKRLDDEPNVVIRGVGGFGNTQGVGFYIDDVQNFTDQSASIEDVERIEILKGPQGTLYGGSNIGGAIKYVMKKPTDMFGFETKAEYGSYNTSNAFAAVNIPVADTFAARISGYARSTDGYIDNVLLDTEANELDEWGVRASLGWNPTDALEVNFSYRHSSLINGGYAYVLASGPTDYNYQISTNEDTHNKRIVDGGILNADLDLGFATLTSVTSYTERTMKIKLDLDYSPADAIAVLTDKDNSTEVFSQELRLTSHDSAAFEWLVGAYYSKIARPSSLSRGNLYLGPLSGGPFLIEDFALSEAKEQQLAAFGTAGYSFGRFKLEGGLRIAKEKFDVDYIADPTVMPTRIKDTQVLPKLVVSYDVTDDAMLYANVAVGSEPGKANTASDIQGLEYEPEKATNYEFGIKGEAASGKLSYDVAVFYIDYKKRQFESRERLPSGLVTEVITNVGDSTSYGLEGGIMYQPNSELTLGASGGYLSAEWDDPEASFNGIIVDGRTVPNSPEFTANAYIDYIKPIGNGLELGARADVSYISKFFWQPLDLDQQPAYGIVNLRLAVSSPEEGWELAIRGDNVFDEGYFTEFTPDVFGPSVGLAAVGQPATVMASVSYKY